MGVESDHHRYNENEIKSYTKKKKYKKWILEILKDEKNTKKYAGKINKKKTLKEEGNIIEYIENSI